MPISFRSLNNQILYAIWGLITYVNTRFTTMQIYRMYTTLRWLWNFNFCVCVFFVLNSEQWLLELFRRGRRSHPAWVRSRVISYPDLKTEWDLGHARPPPLPVLFLFCFVFLSVGVRLFFGGGGGRLSISIFFIAYFMNENFQESNSTVTRATRVCGSCVKCHK